MSETVADVARTVKISVNKLIEKFAEAGYPGKSSADVVSYEEKRKLIEYMTGRHIDVSPRKKEVSQLKTKGKGTGTISVEIRRKKAKPKKPAKPKPPPKSEKKKEEKKEAVVKRVLPAHATKIKTAQDKEEKTGDAQLARKQENDQLDKKESDRQDKKDGIKKSTKQAEEAAKDKKTKSKKTKESKPETAASEDTQAAKLPAPDD